MPAIKIYTLFDKSKPHFKILYNFSLIASYIEFTTSYSAKANLIIAFIAIT